MLPQLNNSTDLGLAMEGDEDKKLNDLLTLLIYDGINLVAETGNDYDDNP